MPNPVHWTAEELAATKARIDQRVLELTPYNPRTHENHQYPTPLAEHPEFSLTMLQQLIDHYMERHRNDQPR